MHYNMGEDGNLISASTENIGAKCNPVFNPCQSMAESMERNLTLTRIHQNIQQNNGNIVSVLIVGITSL